MLASLRQRDGGQVTKLDREGATWAWGAILCAYLLMAGLVLLRIPLLGGRYGVMPFLFQFAVAIVALALDARRLTGARAA